MVNFNIDIEVIYALPHQTTQFFLSLPLDATVRDALEASGILKATGLRQADLKVGVWGEVVTFETPLKNKDRVEIYRPLLCDPKEARRMRAYKSRD